jgi:8-oxo-dGTP diphosphatase
MGQYCYDYPRPAVAVDIAVFAWREGGVEVLLIQRAREPFAGQWALPGGFVDMEETCGEAAARELQEEAGLSNLIWHELRVFDTPRRDPRGRTISVAYLAIMAAGRPDLARSGDDAAAAEWFEVRSLPPLAFDHVDVVQAARDRFRLEVLYRGLAFDLLAETFTAAELAAVYAAALDRPVDSEGLINRLQSLGVVVEVGGQSYRADRARLEYLLREDRLAPWGEV